MGSEIISINGRLLSDIITILLKTIPADGFNLTYKYRILDRDFPEKYALQIEQPEKFQVDYRPAKKGNIRTASLSAAPYSILDKARPSFEDFYRECLDLKIHEREKAAVLTVKTFVPRIIKQFGFDFSKFLESSFSMLKERGTGHLVLDLRNNDGGDSEYLAELLAYLLDRPFRFLERVETPSVRYSFLEYTDKGLFFQPHPSPLMGKG